MVVVVEVVKVVPAPELSQRVCPRAAYVVVVEVVGNAHVVNQYAVELVCQLRYQCGVNGNCRRNLYAIQLAKYPRRL